MPPASPDVARVLERFYDAWSAQDLAALGELLHQDVRWAAPEALPGGGVVAGPAAVLDMAGGLFGEFPTMVAEVDSRDVGAESAVVRGAFVDATGARLPFRHWLRVADGRLLEVRASIDAGDFLRWRGEAAGDGAPGTP